MERSVVKFLQRIFLLSTNDLARLYGESGAAALSISLDEFSAWMQDVLSRLSPTDPPATFLRSLRLNDLVLARACAQGNSAAWDLFLTRYREKLYTAATAIAHDEVGGRELADSLYADLYGTRILDDGHRVSKLNSFQGRGSLEGWLKTLLAQEYVNRFRRERKFVAFDDALETPTHESAHTDHRPALTAATDAVLAGLSGEDRFFLAAYYLDQRTLAEIGRMLGLHESTVSRRLDKITSHLRKQIIALLCKSGIAKAAAVEMLNVDVRDLSINVREKLAQERNA
jgi:RNA polymerase sigma-70 factor (ECF subfamily)